MTDKFVSMTEIKHYLRIDLAEDKHNPVLNMLNEHKTRNIQDWIGRDITQDTYSEYFDIEEDQGSIFLAQYPISSVVGVTDNGIALTEDTDFYAYTNTGIIKIRKIDPSLTSRGLTRKLGDFYPGLRTVTVTYVAGYSPIPGSIKEATLKLINREFYDRGVDDIKSQSSGSQSFTRADLRDGMPVGVYTLLHPYRRQFR